MTLKHSKSATSKYTHKHTMKYTLEELAKACGKTTEEFTIAFPEIAKHIKEA